jgi:clumping factor B
MKASCRCRKIVNLGLALMLGVGAFASSTPVYAAEDSQVSATDNQQNPAEETKSGIYQDQTEVKNREHYKTVGEMSQYMANHNALGVAGEFHLFGNEVEVGSHLTGNVATNKLTSSGSLTIGDHDDSHNATVESIHYVKKFNANDAINLGSSKEYIHIGKDNNVKKDGGHLFVIDGNHEQKIDNATDSVVISENADGSYLDVAKELDKLTTKPDLWSKENQSAGVYADFKDSNKQSIDVSKAEANDGIIFVDLDVKYLEAPQDITIKGIDSSDDSTQIIVINVKYGQNAQDTKQNYNFQTKTHFTYSDGTMITGSQDHRKVNRVLWNFGTTMSKFEFYGAPFLGSMLAPKGTICAHGNIDGNIVANTIEIFGETHEWDLTPDADFVENNSNNDKPDQPDQPKNPGKDNQSGKSDEGDNPDQGLNPQSDDNNDQPSKGDDHPKPVTPSTPEQPNDWEEIIVPGHNNDNHETPSTDDNVPEQPTYPKEPGLEPKHEEDFFKPIENHDEKTVPAISTKTVSNANSVAKTSSVQPKSHQTAFNQVSVSRPANRQQSSAKPSQQTSLPQTNGQNVVAIVGFAFSALAAGLYLSTKKHN